MNAPRTASEFEWPTWLLWVVILVSWALLVGSYGSIPTWVSTPLLVVVLAWYMSFQHELTHGHPTRNATVNRVLGLPPLSIWYPFDTYKIDHLKHHDDAHLTEPGVDPESNYITPELAATLSPLALWLYKSQRTVLGRFLIGPALVNVSLWTRLARAVRKGDLDELQIWSLHLRWWPCCCGCWISILPFRCGITVLALLTRHSVWPCCARCMSTVPVRCRRTAP